MKRGIGDLRIPSVKRSERIAIRVNGRRITAFRGETVLAALAAAGLRKLRKSHVFGEPRGALCGMGVCYECQLTIDRVPNRRACMTEVEEGMEIVIDE